MRATERPVPDESDLVLRVLRGDREAFRPLVDAYEAAVFGLSKRLLDGDEVEAEDLCQEAFLRAYRRLSELKDPRRFGPWLYRIARSLCRDKLRRRRAERRALDVHSSRLRWEAVANPGAEEVGAVLAGLPEGERRALELKYFDGLSYQDIAEAMGLTFAQVDHLIRDARARLGRRLRRSVAARRVVEPVRDGGGALQREPSL
jgi:RNA polymerase sigma-70 factor (ECF subfamily)